MSDDKILLLQITDRFLGYGHYDGDSDYSSYDVAINSDNHNDKIYEYLLNIVSEHNNLDIAPVDLPELVKRIKHHSSSDSWDGFVIKDCDDHTTMVSVREISVL